MQWVSNEVPFTITSLLLGKSSNPNQPLRVTIHMENCPYHKWELWISMNINQWTTIIFIFSQYKSKVFVKKNCHTAQLVNGQRNNGWLINKRYDLFKKKPYEIFYRKLIGLWSQMFKIGCLVECNFFFIHAEIDGKWYLQNGIHFVLIFICEPDSTASSLAIWYIKP